jgi:hypothetical protein
MGASLDTWEGFSMIQGRTHTQKNIRSDSQDSPDARALKNLLTAFIQSGRDPMSGAIIIQYLRDNKTLALTKEGRELFRECAPSVRGSVWEDALYPPPPDTEVEKAKKLMNESWERIQRGDRGNT